jgi:hypothetical protein
MDLRLSQLRSEARKFRKNSPRLYNRISSLIELVKRRVKFKRLGDLDYDLVGLKFKVTGRLGVMKKLISKMELKL